MIDNVTLVKQSKPIRGLNWAHGEPFEHKGIFYSPEFSRVQLIRYKGQLKNLRLYVYREKAFLINSLHKFWHGCNFTNFNLTELKLAIEAISEATGTGWELSTIKKIEYGCNVSVNADSVINSLLSYKSKDFHPMLNTGLKYGASCDFEQFRIKGYDKAFEVKKAMKINLPMPLMRWEVQAKNLKYFRRFKLSFPIETSHLLKPEFLTLLANDAINIYKSSLKKQQLHLSKLSAHEKRVLAAMLIPEIRKDLKTHNKETYKRDQRIYKRIMTDENICINDDTAELLDDKFKQLIGS